MYFIVNLNNGNLDVSKINVYEIENLHPQNYPHLDATCHTFKYHIFSTILPTKPHYLVPDKLWENISNEYIYIYIYIYISKIGYTKTNGLQIFQE